MLLKNRSAPLSQPAQPTEAASQEDASQEDAWLNDVGPLSIHESATECEPEVTLVRQAEPEENPPTEDFSAEQMPVSIGPDHRLWSLVLALSERIWHELHQKPDLSSVPETVLVKFVHKRAIDILRTEPALVQQVSDITQAKLLLQGITTEVLGYGPLEALLKDESISKIMVLGPHLTSIERDRKVEDVACSFADDQHMLRIVENMLRRAGRRLVPGWPLVVLRLRVGRLGTLVFLRRL